MPTATRDRIVEQAMRLFGEHGFRGTTITRIEAAAGLTPGAGGVYHHFRSKEEILATGIRRQLGRLDALREIRRVLSPLDDPAAELTVTARYVLAELESESELLRILASEARNRPQLLADAVEQLIGSSLTGFAGWIREHSEGQRTEDEARAIAALGLGSLLSTRLLGDVLGVQLAVGDEALVRAWVQMMLAMLPDPHESS